MCKKLSCVENEYYDNNLLLFSSLLEHGKTDSALI